MRMQISVKQRNQKRKGLTVVDTACGRAACGCGHRWGTQTCWCSDALHVRADGLPVDADKCKEKEKEKKNLWARKCVACACGCVACGRVGGRTRMTVREKKRKQEERKANLLSTNPARRFACGHVACACRRG